MFNTIKSKLEKKYKNNKYIIFLSLLDDTELLLLYHRAMINIDILQKSFIPSLLEKSRLSPNLETLNIPGIRKIEENEIDLNIFKNSFSRSTTVISNLNFLSVFSFAKWT